MEKNLNIFLIYSYKIIQVTVSSPRGKHRDHFTTNWKFAQLASVRGVRGGGGPVAVENR